MNISNKHYRLSARSLLAAALLLSLWSVSLEAQERSGARGDGEKSEGAFTESSDEITNTLEDVRKSRDEMEYYQPFHNVWVNWDNLWRFVDDETGLSMGFSYTTLYQVATKGHYTGPRDGGSGDLDIFGRLNIFDDDLMGGLINKGTIGFATEYRHKIGPTTPAELGDSLGSLWGTATAFNEQDFSLVQWWWQQKLLSDQLSFRIGKLDMSYIFDVYRFNSPNHFFLNSAFSDNPAIPFPQNGFGAVFTWEPGYDLFVITGGGDANGRKTETLVNPNDDINEWFMATTFGWNPKVGDFGRGLYQVTVWHSDRRSNSEKPSATGASLVLQQDLGNGWTPFARYAYSDAAAVDTRQIITAGAVREGMGKREDDRLGIALAWGQPHESKYREQWTAELFYRWAVIPEFRITPLAQIIINPSKNPHDRLIGVVGLRARLTF